MRRLVLTPALACTALANAAVHPAPLAAQVATAPLSRVASLVHAGPAQPGVFAPGTAGWDLLGAGLINVARLVRRRRPT